MAASDIDVLIISDELSHEEAFALLEPAERKLGRKINPTILTSEGFAQRRRTQQPFLTRVPAGRHVVLMGSEDGLPA